MLMRGWAKNWGGDVRERKKRNRNEMNELNEQKAAWSNNRGPSKGQNRPIHGAKGTN